MNLAEMVNTANYSAMSYKDLLELNFALTWAKGNIEPIIPAKRMEEMLKLTHAYATAMNGYLATRSEIETCLSKEDIAEKPAFSDMGQDVDDQSPVTTPAEEATRNQDKGEALPALPEAPVSIQGDVDFFSVEAHTGNVDSAVEPVAQEPAEEPTNEQTATMEDKAEEITSEEVSTPAEANQEEPKEMTLVEKAIEIMKSTPAPNGVDANAPYFVEKTFYESKEVGLDYDYHAKGKNLTIKELNDLRYSAEMVVRYIRNGEILSSSEDILVYKLPDHRFVVREYRIPDGYTEVIAKPVADTEKKALTEDELADEETMKSLMIKAMKQARKMAKKALIEEALDPATPCYEKYTFSWHVNNWGLIAKEPHFRDSLPRCYADTSILADIKTALEAYAQLYYHDARVMSTEDCVAVKTDKVYVVFFNIPTDKEKKVKGKKAAKLQCSDCKTEPKTEPTSVPSKTEPKTESTASDSTPEPEVTNPLILKAVEITRSLPVSNGTDANAPYYINCNFGISGDAPVLEGTTFSANVSAEEFEARRKSACRYASTMKASELFQAKDYTAFISRDCKHVSVYCYMSMES